jgi:putative ABC transport system permease protein
VIGGSVVWIGLLAFGNVRERTAEIGILRAVGLARRKIFTLFIARAMLLGLIGAALGYVGGFLAARYWGQADDLPVSADALFSPYLPAICLVAAPVLSAMACWLPATLAARQDPAVTLRDA